MFITIDGPAASGKSTIAYQAAFQLTFFYLNTGLLFRAAAYLLQTEYAGLVDTLITHLPTLITSQAVQYQYTSQTGAAIFYNSVCITPFLKTASIDALSSYIGTLPTVRNILAEWQKNLVRNKDAVIEGRDSGSVVFPQAQLRIFLTADISTRVERWLTVQQQYQKQYTYAQAYAYITDRDTQDATRLIAPLTSAHANLIIDTTHLTIKQVVETIQQAVAQSHT